MTSPLTRIARSGAAISLAGTLLATSLGTSAWAVEPAHVGAPNVSHTSISTSASTPSTPSADEDEFTSTVIEKDKGYSDVAHTDALPWVVARCLMGLGLKGPQITQIMTKGTPEAFWAAGGRAALACLRGE